MRGPAVNTAIEQRMHDALMAAGIGFTTQSVLLGRYLVDIELHQAPIVIEADGSQHTLRIQKAKDAERDAALTAAGYRVFRFTGSEINTDAAVCVQRVIDTCELVPEQAPDFDDPHEVLGRTPSALEGRQARVRLRVVRNVTFLAQPKHRTGKHVYCSRQCCGKGQTGTKLGPMLCRAAREDQRRPSGATTRSR